jgi:hypothetical protein
MSRIYAVSFSNVEITALQDIFEIQPAAQKPVRLAGLWLVQTTDFGDAQDEVLRIAIRRGNTTSGSGGTVPTPVVVSSSTGAAAGFVSEVNNTTQASVGTAQTLFVDGWNVRAPYQMLWPEDMRPGATLTNTLLAIELSAPADSITVSGCLYVEELG